MRNIFATASFFSLFITSLILLTPNPVFAQSSGNCTIIGVSGANPLTVGRQATYRASQNCSANGFCRFYVRGGPGAQGNTGDTVTFTPQAPVTYQIEFRKDDSVTGANVYTCITHVMAQGSTSTAATTTPASTNTSTTPTPSGGGFCGIGETRLEEFVGKLLGCGLGLVGGVGMLFIIYGGFLLMVSAGDPQRVRIGKEYITYAIVGLLLAVLTLVIVQIIGVDILHIPGLGN